jgi:transcriptional regulator with XRE-family HTH domain
LPIVVFILSASANFVKRFFGNFVKFFYLFCRKVFMSISGCAIVERVDSLLKEKKDKRGAVCKALSISASSFTDWSKRGTIPAADTVLALADYLSVSIRWLLTGEDERGLSRDESSLIVKYQSLMPHEQKAVQGMISGLLAGRASGLGEELP